MSEAIREDIKLVISTPAHLQGLVAAQTQLKALRVAAGTAIPVTRNLGMAMSHGVVGSARKAVPALKATTVGMQELGDTVQSAAAKVALWTIATTAVLGSLRLLQQGIKVYSEVESETMRLVRVGRNLDQGFATTRKGAEALTDKVLALQRQLGGAGQEAFDAAVTFSRLGLTVTEAAKATRVAIMAQNIAEVGAADAAKYLASAMLQFKLEASDIPRILDDANTLSNNYRVTTLDLFQAIGRGGTVFREAGGSLQEFMAITAAVAQATSQTGTKIGTAFKTVATRMGRLDTQRTVFRLLNKDLVDVHGNFMPIMDVIGELAVQFTHLTEAQRAELSIAMAGVRRRNILIAAVDNYWTSIGALIKELTSLNSAQIENTQVMDQLKIKARQLAAAGKELAMVMGDSGLGRAAKVLLDGLTGLVQILTQNKVLIIAVAAGMASFAVSTLEAVGLTKLFTASLIKLNVSLGVTWASVATTTGQLALLQGALVGVVSTIKVLIVAFARLAWAMLSTPLGLLITGMTALALRAAYLHRQQEKLIAQAEKATHLHQQQADAMTTLAKTYDKVATAVERLLKVGTPEALAVLKKIQEHIGTTDPDVLRENAEKARQVGKEEASKTLASMRRQLKIQRDIVAKLRGPMSLDEFPGAVASRLGKTLTFRKVPWNQEEVDLARAKKNAPALKAALLEIAELKKDISKAVLKSADDVIGTAKGIRSVTGELQRMKLAAKHSTELKQVFAVDAVEKAKIAYEDLVMQVQALLAMKRDLDKKEGYNEAARKTQNEIEAVQKLTDAARQLLKIEAKRERMNTGLRRLNQQQRLMDAVAKVGSGGSAYDNAVARERSLEAQIRQQEALVRLSKNDEEQKVRQKWLAKARLDLEGRRLDTMIAQLDTEKQITDQVKQQLGQMSALEIYKVKRLAERGKPLDWETYIGMRPKDRKLADMAGVAPQLKAGAQGGAMGGILANILKNRMGPMNKAGVQLQRSANALMTAAQMLARVAQGQPPGGGKPNPQAQPPANIVPPPAPQPQNAPQGQPPAAAQPPEKPLTKRQQRLKDKQEKRDARVRWIRERDAKRKAVTEKRREAKEKREKDKRDKIEEQIRRRRERVGKGLVPPPSGIIGGWADTEATARPDRESVERKWEAKQPRDRAAEIAERQRLIKWKAAGLSPGEIEDRKKAHERGIAATGKAKEMELEERAKKEQEARDRVAKRAKEQRIADLKGPHIETVEEEAARKKKKNDVLWKLLPKNTTQEDRQNREDNYNKRIEPGIRKNEREAAERRKSGVTGPSGASDDYGNMLSVESLREKEAIRKLLELKKTAKRMGIHPNDPYGNKARLDATPAVAGNELRRIGLRQRIDEGLPPSAADIEQDRLSGLEKGRAGTQGMDLGRAKELYETIQEGTQSNAVLAQQVEELGKLVKELKESGQEIGEKSIRTQERIADGVEKKPKPAEAGPQPKKVRM